MQGCSNDYYVLTIRTNHPTYHALPVISTVETRLALSASKQSMARSIPAFLAGRAFSPGKAISY